MNMDDKIKRINELYHKAQSEGLTEEEKQEKAVLYKDYIASFRGNLKAQLDSITVVRPDGSKVSLKEEHDKKYGTDNQA